MNEKSVLLTLIITAAMLGTVIAPARAWEGWDTTLSNPVTNNGFQLLGPRVDKVQIQIYADETAALNAMEAGIIDLTDCPVDSSRYASWTSPPLNDKIAVVAQGQAFDMFILDMRLDNRSQIASGVPNPAYNAHNGNPMANLALRRAIASICDRQYTLNQIISGGHPPILAEPLYTPLSSEYGSWVHPEITPTGALAQWCYVLAGGSANVAGGLAWLAVAGYTYNAGGDYTTDPTGYKFTLDFYYRVDHTYRRRFATEVVQPLMEAAPPLGLGLKGNLVMHGITSASARSEVMSAKKGHMYTGGWGLTIDPDHLYYLFNVDGYRHPSKSVPQNYMYYPGDADHYTVPSWGGWTYTGFPAKYGWATSGLDFSDPSGKIYNYGDIVWTNPGNYWSWELMTATTEARAKFCALKCQEWDAWYVCGVPIWASMGFTAFSRSYVGSETPYKGQHWIQVVNQKGVGVGNAYSLFNMHITNPWWGSYNPSNPVTIRWGFSQGVNSLNPIYADWASDWNVLGCCYNSLIGSQPYLSTDLRSLADSWTIKIGTYAGKSCTQIDFKLKNNLHWSDNTLVKASDVVFTLGGPNQLFSLSWWLNYRHLPPAYWSQQVAHNLACYSPSVGYVRLFVDALPAYFGTHSMSGFVPILPQHPWMQLLGNSNPAVYNQVTLDFAGSGNTGLPSVCSGGFKLETAENPMYYGGVINLNRNVGWLNWRGVPSPSLPVPKNSYYQPDEFVEDAAPPGVAPISIYAAETSNATEEVDSTHYIFPKANITGVNLNVSYVLEEQWAYETGENLTDIYPYTRFGGGVNVTLKRWNGTSPYSDPANYAMWGGNGTSRTFLAEMGVPVAESITFMNVGPGWYVAEVSVNIASLEYSVDNGTSWVPVPSDQNPFYGVAYSYDEYTLITSRYDILGAYWETINSTGYQPVSDLGVDVKDLYACGKAYGSEQGYPNWNPACDINNDYTVDIKDYYKISQNYGWTAPMD